jgi:hypothetical protein
MRACDAAGFFDPENSVRGPGVWPFGPVKEWPRRDARVVVHTGAWVYVFDHRDRRSHAALIAAACASAISSMRGVGRG